MRFFLSSILTLSIFLFSFNSNILAVAGPAQPGAGAAGNGKAAQQNKDAAQNNFNVSQTQVCIDGTTGVQTAIGCISTDFTSGGFIRTILGVSVGLGGGIALCLILYGIFIITTSAGVPDKLKQGQEILTGAITGLIFIILSIVMMNLIGVQILQLPGL